MKNEKNRPSKGLDEWKTEKIARPRGWMNEKQKKSLAQGVGKAPNNIFCSSKGWEMQPLRFFILPKFGKAFFRRFSVFPMLGKYLPLIFGFPSRGKSVFRYFLVFPREGKPFFANFLFSLMRES